MQNFVYGLKYICKSSWELKVIFLMNILVSFQYYILTTITPLYFSMAMKESDTESGLIFGGLGVLIGLTSIMFGTVVDKVGVKVALIISTICSTTGFFAQSISENLTLSVIALMFFQTIGTSLAWPVVELGVKQFSRRNAWNTCDSIVILSNYLSGIPAGILIDYNWDYDNPQHGHVRFIYGITGIIGAFSLAIALFFASFSRKSAMIDEGDELYGEAEPEEKLINSKFWRYLCLIFLLVLLRSGCFGHLDATLAKYLIRSEKISYFGSYLALHSISMLIGTLGFTPLSYIFSSYTLIVAGGLMGSLAPFVMLTDFYYKVSVFTVVLSLGESLWVPRLLDYTIHITSRHHEGVYLALCNCPFYFGMIITGIESGRLLETYCPENGSTENCDKIWLIIGLATIFIPFLLIMLRKKLEQPNRSMPLNPSNGVQMREKNGSEE